jgi:hypothetical protein
MPEIRNACTDLVVKPKEGNRRPCILYVEMDLKFVLVRMAQRVISAML